MFNLVSAVETRRVLAIAGPEVGIGMVEEDSFDHCKSIEAANIESGVNVGLV